MLLNKNITCGLVHLFIKRKYKFSIKAKLGKSEGTFTNKHFVLKIKFGI